VVQGDVVIVDTANASAFTTTTTGAYSAGRVGVVLEPNGIANNATGMIAFCGYVPVINLSGTGSVGDLVKTHTVAKQGARHAAPGVQGDFAQVLGTGASPTALLFGTVQLGSSGAVALTNSSISPTTSNVTAAVGTRYFANISGLTANRNFVLPTCATGDEIVLKITTGDDTYSLILIGDTGVSIEGGSTATAWSPVFITGECIHLVASGTNAWAVIQDGRISCKGLMTLSAAETTNSAGVEATPTWDNAVINVGDICDLTNYRFNVRRAGYYRLAGSYKPNSAYADQKYGIIYVYQNATAITRSDGRQSSSGGSAVTNVSALSPKSVLCAVGDTLQYRYAAEEANKGMSAAVESSWFQVIEER